MFEHAQHDRRTRQVGQLRLPRVRTEIGKRRLMYAGAKLFNDLPVAMQETASMLRFKERLMNILSSSE